MPAPWRALGEAQANAIKPIDGKIGFVSIGMSITSRFWAGEETSRPGKITAVNFADLTYASPGHNPALVLVNGTKSSRRVERWAEKKGPWSHLLTKVEEAGLTAGQVQVAWMLHHSKTPWSAGEFDGHLRTVLRRIWKFLPNVKLVYISSVNYVGYAPLASYGEDAGWNAQIGTRQTINAVINGEVENVPWTAWGPYLWCDGVKPNTNGLSWSYPDDTEDGVHPAKNGIEKVANYMLEWFENEPTARPWYMRA